MCEDIINSMKTAHKKAVRTLEKILEDSESEFNYSQTERVHYLVDIIKDCEKMKALYEEGKEGG